MKLKSYLSNVYFRKFKCHSLSVLNKFCEKSCKIKQTEIIITVLLLLKTQLQADPYIGKKTIEHFINKFFGISEEEIKIDGGVYDF